MNQLLRNPYTEGLKLFRLLMVLASLTPLFVLWAVRGNNLIPEPWFILGCILFAAIPNILIVTRVIITVKRRDQRRLTIGAHEDHRGHIAGYILSMLLPFYRQDFDTCRELAAIFTAIAFIVFLFWHLNLHYMNFLFALFDYRIFTVQPAIDDNPYSGTTNYVLLTKRRNLATGSSIAALRLTNTVYLERST